MIACVACGRILDVEWAISELLAYDLGGISYLNDDDLVAGSSQNVRIPDLYGLKNGLFMMCYVEDGIDRLPSILAALRV